MFSMKYAGLFFLFLLLTNMISPTCYGSEMLVENTDVNDNKDSKYKAYELDGSIDICRYVINRFDDNSGKLTDAYDWNNVKEELLENPKEYYGYIKYLLVDIDNDGEKEYLVKVFTYLGGTLSSLNLIVSSRETLFMPPVSAEKILRNALFSLNTEGKKSFLRESERLKKTGVNIYDPKVLYGFSAYQLQNKLIDVFDYEGKKYFLLNNYIDPYGEKTGLVLSISKSLENYFKIRHVCFFMK